MSEQPNYVVKISTALSNKPMFVRIADPTYSLDKIFTEAISTLRNTGKPLESQQLEQLFKQHQIFHNGKVVGKGDLFRDLEAKTQSIGNQAVQMVELDLVSSHHGGSYQEPFFYLFFRLFEDRIHQIDKSLINIDNKKDQIIRIQQRFIADLKLILLHPDHFIEAMKVRETIWNE